jgi:hypothetical protein
MEDIWTSRGRRELEAGEDCIMRNFMFTVFAKY